MPSSTSELARVFKGATQMAGRMHFCHCSETGPRVFPALDPRISLDIARNQPPSSTPSWEIFPVYSPVRRLPATVGFRPSQEIPFPDILDEEAA